MVIAVSVLSASACGTEEPALDIKPSSNDTTADPTTSAPTVDETAGEAADRLDERLGALGLAVPTDDAPVSVASTLGEDSVAAGADVWVGIKVQLAPGWHIYAYDPTSRFILTEYSVATPDGIKATGEWSQSGASPYYADPQIMVYVNDLQLKRPLSIADDLSPGTYDVSVDFKYQACNPRICLPPETTSQTLTLSVKEQAK